MTYSPNLPIGSGWKSTLQIAFQTLRRIKFIIESDFQWKDFDPNLNFYGMTVTNLLVPRCRYLLLGNIIYFSIDIRCTLGGAAANIITVSLPENIITPPTNYSSATQGGGAFYTNAGVEETGFWLSRANRNTIDFQRAGYANFGAGAFIGIANGFIEII